MVDVPALPARPVSRSRKFAGRAGRFLLRTWSGRLLVAALVTRGLLLVGVPVPGFVAGLDRLVLVLFCGYAIFRLSRFAIRRLLWTIRAKLIVSYLFIALVPMVLAAAFFVLAAVLFVGLVAAHLVTADIDQTASTLATVAQASLPGLPPGEGAAGAALAERLAPARAIHPRLSYALVRRGRTVIAAGTTAPHQLPPWWRGESFAGLVATTPGTIRAVRAESADTFLALDVPLDPQLFLGLERRMGIHVFTDQELELPGREARREQQTDAPSSDVILAGGESPGEHFSIRSASGLAFVAVPERTDWNTGEKGSLRPIAFRFRPLDLAEHLAPGFKAGGMGTLADALVYAMGAVGTIFLLVYAAALVLGLLLARSITRSVHALSVGTERLRRGDFDARIAVRSRDQLGELAESFNHMLRGMQDLLRQQTEKERLEEELRIARRIQMSLLPAQGAVSLVGVRVAALCLPATEVGGDYYDLLPLSETRLAVLVADVSGKGTSAALYMAELKGLVLSLSLIHSSPAKLLADANRILAATMDSRSFITMTYAVVDTVARTMRFARAGHSPIIHLEASSGETHVLVPPGLGLGLDPGERFEAILEEAVVPLGSGDVFLFFTDGLSEAMNTSAELFGEGRLRDIVGTSGRLGSEEIKERILSEIRGFVGDASPHDDMTLVVLKVA